MSARGKAAIAALIALPLLLAACGEKEQVVVYKQGKYQGKADQKPYDNDTFKGNKDNWERDIATRAQAQNEYKRIN